MVCSRDHCAATEVGSVKNFQILKLISKPQELFTYHQVDYRSIIKFGIDANVFVCAIDCFDSTLLVFPQTDIGKVTF